MINITIIGLGPLGTSIGFALKKYCNNLGSVLQRNYIIKIHDLEHRQLYSEKIKLSCIMNV